MLCTDNSGYSILMYMLHCKDMGMLHCKDMGMKCLLAICLLFSSVVFIWSSLSDHSEALIGCLSTQSNERSEIIRLSEYLPSMKVDLNFTSV